MRRAQQTSGLLGLIAIIGALAMVLMAAGCSASGADRDDDRAAGRAAESRSEGPGDEGSDESPNPAPEVRTPGTGSGSSPEPRHFVPAGPVGDGAAYRALIERLEGELPAGLHDEVPWPDLRHPDPAVAQLDIFELWVWVEEHAPHPRFAEAMASADGPLRLGVAAHLGELHNSGHQLVRPQEPYVAFDQRVVTFESAGLPLWLGRDVPNDAVVIYYQDQSGVGFVRDTETGDQVREVPAVGARQWLSIMVPTEVGWLAFNDELIEPSDPDLSVPDLAQPLPTPGPRSLDV